MKTHENTAKGFDMFTGYIAPLLHDIIVIFCSQRYLAMNQFINIIYADEYEWDDTFTIH